MLNNYIFIQINMSYQTYNWHSICGLHWYQMFPGNRPNGECCSELENKIIQELVTDPYSWQPDWLAVHVILKAYLRKLPPVIMIFCASILNVRSLYSFSSSLSIQQTTNKKRFTWHCGQLVFIMLNDELATLWPPLTEKP